MSEQSRKHSGIRQDDIEVLPVREEDLIEFCTVIYDTFPPSLWEPIEDHSPTSASRATRIKRFAEHWHALQSTHGSAYHLLKAVSKTNRGLILGVATWIESSPRTGARFPTAYPTMPDSTFPSHYAPAPFRDDIADPLAWREKMSWSAADVAEIYEHHSEAWRPQFCRFEEGRLNEMGATPHFYLAPLCVRPEYQGRGVGRKLLMWGLERADAADPQIPCVLEALSKARGMYVKFGYEDTEGHGRFKETQMVRPPGGGKRVGE